MSYNEGTDQVTMVISACACADEETGLFTNEH